MKTTVLAALLIAPVLAAAQAPGQRSAVIAPDCDRACLVGFLQGYMQALAKRAPAQARLAGRVRFTENNVEMPIGTHGLWATVTGVAATGLEVADASTGEAAWIGTAEENGVPVYYGMRIQVRGQAITEVESIVVRTTGLPLPFGDVRKIVHDPAFNEVLPPAERRPRERLLAVADSYFDTVELNDGMVFAPFADDCARLENGILTTASGPGSAGAIAAGCEAQFKLGIYRINKRIRERRYPIVDVERGVVVATGFFDHANEFDTYKTTDGIERKTALKWPNSISLVEAFRIREGRIQRIETVFTYVPYFMHSPFYVHAPQRPLRSRETASAAAEQCDRACLLGLADRYMDALVKREPEGLPWAPQVRFTENSVPLMIGDGLWGSVRRKGEAALRVADPATGNVAWYGTVYDHDAPAYFGLRLGVRNGRIAEVETLVARYRNPGPFGEPAKFVPDASLAQPLPSGERRSRERMQALVDGYASSVQDNDGTLLTQIDPACARVENGVAVTQGSAGSAVIAKAAGTLARGCEAQLKLGLYAPVDEVRARRVPVIDEELGIAVQISFADFPLSSMEYAAADGRKLQTQDKYPSSRELFEVFKLRNGRIRRIDAVSVFQPYRMPSPWER